MELDVDEMHHKRRGAGAGGVNNDLVFDLP